MKLALGVVVQISGKPMVELPGDDSGNKYHHHIENYEELKQAAESEPGSVVEFGYGAIPKYVALFRYGKRPYARFIRISKVAVKK